MKASSTTSPPHLGPRTDIFRPRFLLHKMTKIALIFSLSSTSAVWAGHPSMNGMPAEMEHPTQAIPNDALTPAIDAELISDTMDGFNIELNISNFDVVIPRRETSDYLIQKKHKVMRGHLHVYINNEKKMRLYGNALHIPSAWLSLGINTITISANNHMHGTFTTGNREIQTTFIIDTRKDDEGLIKSKYRWPNAENATAAQ